MVTNEEILNAVEKNYDDLLYRLKLAFLIILIFILVCSLSIIAAQVGV